jgi:hypothetical protein
MPVRIQNGWVRRTAAVLAAVMSTASVLVEPAGPAEAQAYPGYSSPGAAAYTQSNPGYSPGAAPSNQAYPGYSYPAQPYSGYGYQAQPYSGYADPAAYSGYGYPCSLPILSLLWILWLPLLGLGCGLAVVGLGRLVGPRLGLGRSRMGRRLGARRVRACRVPWRRIWGRRVSWRRGWRPSLAS